MPLDDKPVKYCTCRDSISIPANKTKAFMEVSTSIDDDSALGSETYGDVNEQTDAYVLIKNVNFVLKIVD